MASPRRRKSVPLPEIKGRAAENSAPAPTPSTATSDTVVMSPSGAVESPHIISVVTETVTDAMIVDPGRWQRAGDGTFYYGDAQGTFVSIGDPNATIVKAEDAWKKVLAFSDETVQLWLFVMARCLSEHNDRMGTRIHVNEALSSRGVKPHAKGGFRQEQKRAAARDMRLFSEIFVTSREEIEIKVGRGTRKRPINVSSRLVEFALESEIDAEAQRTGSLTLPSIVSANSTDIPFTFIVTLGKWATPFLQPGTTHLRTSTILTKIGKYNVSLDAPRFAMRIAMAMVFGRIIGLQLTIREVLSAARIDVPDARVSGFKEKIEEAFETLTRDGLIGGWRYLDDTPLPATRWTAKWLAWNILFRPPPAPLETKLA